MSTPSQPKISIVTPVYNGADYIEELILSIKNQTYPNIEHIVIDDGSKDDGRTVAILEKYPHLKWWTRPNKGQYATLNEGFRATTGDFVTTISHDDLYTDERVIEDVVNHIRSHPDAEVVHGDTLFMDSQGVLLPNQRFQAYPYWIMPYNPFIYHCSLFAKGDRLRREEMYFDETMKYVGDADWMVRMYLAGYKHSHMKRYISKYRYHESQATTIADRNSAAFQAKSAERKRFDDKYVKNKFLKRVAMGWATYERRKSKILASLRTGGLRRLFQTIDQWRGSRGPRDLQP
ncbi:MAG: glycosyltransferase [Fimbriimonas sp.]